MLSSCLYAAWSARELQGRLFLPPVEDLERQGDAARRIKKKGESHPLPRIVFPCSNPRNARALPLLGSPQGLLVPPVPRLGLEGVAAAVLPGARLLCKVPLYFTGCLMQQYREQRRACREASNTV